MRVFVILPTTRREGGAGIARFPTQQMRLGIDLLQQIDADLVGDLLRLLVLVLVLVVVVVVFIFFVFFVFFVVVVVVVLVVVVVVVVVVVFFNVCDFLGFGRLIWR